jgi:hypothetical protein
MKENLEHGCSFKFIFKVGVEVEDSIFCLNLTSLFALFYQFFVIYCFFFIFNFCFENLFWIEVS